MLIAYNLGEFRRAAGLTQKELGERIGLSEASVSAAERSWAAKRVREFDADEIVRISDALGVPVVALLLPPPDAGTAVDYVFDFGAETPDGLADMLVHLAPSYGNSDSPQLQAYRQRLMALGAGAVLDDPIADAISTVIGGVLKRGRLEADEILTKGRMLAEQFTSDARARAEGLEHDAQERHRQAMGSLVQSREELERRVNDLRMFEREYRSRMLAYFEGMIRDLQTGAADSGVFPALGTGPPQRSIGPDRSDPDATPECES
jgi:transcriptional regulator with XRE-family HTH domain